MSYKRGALTRVEALLASHGFKLRYEKGNFKSGFCLVKQSKIVIVNKFFNSEARYKCLVDILSVLDIEDAELDNNPPKNATKVEESPEVAIS